MHPSGIPCILGIHVLQIQQVICLYPLCIPFASSASQGAKLHSLCIPFASTASTVLKLPASLIYGCIHISSTMHLMHPMHPHYIFNTSSIHPQCIQFRVATLTWDYKYFYSYSAGIDFSRQNLTSTDVRFCVDVRF